MNGYVRALRGQGVIILGSGGFWIWEGVLQTCGSYLWISWFFFLKAKYLYVIMEFCTVCFDHAYLPPSALPRLASPFLSTELYVFYLKRKLSRVTSDAQISLPVWTSTAWFLSLELHTLLQNWLSLREGESVNSSSTQGQTLYPLLPNTLGFCLAGTCAGFVYACTTVVNSYVQFPFCVQVICSHPVV